MFNWKPLNVSGAAKRAADFTKAMTPTPRKRSLTDVDSDAHLVEQWNAATTEDIVTACLRLRSCSCSRASPAIPAIPAVLTQIIANYAASTDVSRRLISTHNSARVVSRMVGNSAVLPRELAHIATAYAAPSAWDTVRFKAAQRRHDFRVVPLGLVGDDDDDGDDDEHPLVEFTNVTMPYKPTVRTMPGGNAGCALTIGAPMTSNAHFHAFYTDGKDAIMRNAKANNVTLFSLHERTDAAIDRNCHPLHKIMPKRRRFVPVSKPDGTIDYFPPTVDLRVALGGGGSSSSAPQLIVMDKHTHEPMCFDDLGNGQHIDVLARLESQYVLAHGMFGVKPRVIGVRIYPSVDYF
jgi:hypothetical protein